MAPRPRTVPRALPRTPRGACPSTRVSEKVEQQHTVAMLTAIGAVVYVLGNHRATPTGTCPKCGALIALRDRRHFTTMQTEGISDLVGFLPLRDGRRAVLFAELKAAGGRLSPAQVVFRDLVLTSTAHHVVGDQNAVIAFLLAHGYIHEGSVPHYRLPRTGAPSTTRTGA